MAKRVENQIKWTKSDYAKLSYAVRKFNKNVEKLDLVNQTTYLEQKTNIKTRRGFNQVLNYLNSVSSPDALNEITLNNGVKMAKFQYDEFLRARKFLKSKLNKEKVEWEKKEPNAIFSKAQLNPSEYDTILADLERLNNIEKLKPSKFRDMVKSVITRGNFNYQYRKAEIFKENYMETMERYSDLKGFDELQKIMNKYKNAESFYNFFEPFEIAGDLTLLSDKTLQQQEFNVMLEEMGIDTSTKEVV